MYLHVLDRLEKEILKTLSINLVISMFLLYKFDKVCLSNKLFYSINIKKEICYCTCRSMPIPWSVFNYFWHSNLIQSPLNCIIDNWFIHVYHYTKMINRILVWLFCYCRNFYFRLWNLICLKSTKYTKMWYS